MSTAATAYLELVGKPALVSVGANDLVIGATGTGSLVLFGNGSEKLRINSAGVGMGITPTHALNVWGGLGGEAGVAVFSNSPVADVNAGIRIDAQTGPTHVNWTLGAQKNINNGFEITPSTASGGITFSTPAISILNTGAVGIGTGTALPAEQLHVAVDIASESSGLRVDNKSLGGYGSALKLFSTQNFGSNVAVEAGRIATTGAANWASAPNTSSDMIFSTVLAGTLAEKFRISSAGALSANKTITAGGTTGARTINNPVGTVNFAAAATSLVVTNSLVTTSSIVLAVIRTADANNPLIRSVVCASGSFTITISTGPAAEMSVGFFVMN